MPDDRSLIPDAVAPPLSDSSVQLPSERSLVPLLRPSRSNQRGVLWGSLLAVVLLGSSLYVAMRSGLRHLPLDPHWQTYPAPLVMQGGNPYIRALMRTISAAESNSSRPYSILYGGDHVEDLSRHPDRCVTIVAGPNRGNCSTAAGRYQFITTTWQEKAALYHPDPPTFWFWGDYSFAPEYQDQVVYRWLSDPQAWGIDLTELLQQGQLQDVLRILSPTWTSLGYGIESNVMTHALPSIYEQVLQEELQAASALKD
ncbi:MAG: glycoside hydrolase family protein [Synechococcales cyanobacterium M58_A2018_015]|nr:glycoside hydrolase family protein [Synechococcales cyanobacterium M58_A2018_015]